jgi:hypothetical protein
MTNDSPSIVSECDEGLGVLVFTTGSYVLRVIFFLSLVNITAIYLK